jgi:hypothetical protein
VVTTTDNPAQASSEAAAPEEKPNRRTATVNLPFVTAQFRLPELPVDRLRAMSPELGQVARGAASFLPPPERLAYYTGLGALAAFQVIEWPVAVAIGAGTAVAGRSRGSGADWAGSDAQRQPKALPASAAPIEGSSQGPPGRRRRAQPAAP